MNILKFKYFLWVAFCCRSLVSTLEDKRYRALIRKSDDKRNPAREAIVYALKTETPSNREHALLVILKEMERTWKFSILQFLLEIKRHDPNLVEQMNGLKVEKFNAIRKTIRSNNTEHLKLYLQTYPEYYNEYIKEMLEIVYQSDLSNFDAIFDFLHQWIYPLNRNNLVGYSEFLDILKNAGHLKNHKMLKIAMRLKCLETMLKTREEYNETEFNRVIDKLPENLRSILWNDLVITNEKINSVLRVTHDISYYENIEERQVFNQKVGQPHLIYYIEFPSQWTLEPSDANKCTFRIKNPWKNEYLFASDKKKFHEWKQNITDKESIVFTLVGGEEVESGYWELIPLYDNFTLFSIQNVFYNEYLKGINLKPEVGMNQAKTSLRVFIHLLVSILYKITGAFLNGK